MFCQKCGKENSDDATFCNSCGANITKKSTPTATDVQVATYVQLKENEIRRLEEKLNKENSALALYVMAIIIGIAIGLLSIFIIGPVGVGAGFAVFVLTKKGSTSRSEAVSKTEFELNSAKAELVKMKNA